MNVTCSITEAEIKEAIALWFQHRYGIPHDLIMSMIILKATNNVNYYAGDISASVILTESFLQELNKKNKASSHSMEERAEDVFPPDKKKSAELQLDVE